MAMENAGAPVFFFFFERRLDVVFVTFGVHHCGSDRDTGEQQQGVPMDTAVIKNMMQHANPPPAMQLVYSIPR